MAVIKKYVLCFAFNAAGYVVLIRKRRPEWQAGLLNGVGGSLEGKEFANDAAEREFLEEAGVRVPKYDWWSFCRLAGPTWEVSCLTTPLKVNDYHTCTDEEVGVYDPRRLPRGPGGVVANLHWLVPLAEDHLRHQELMQHHGLLHGVVTYPQ